MARRWRSVQQLLLGLALKESVGLLLTGTIQGLTSYVNTMNTVDSKLAEFYLLDNLKPAVVAIVSAPPPSSKPGVLEDKKTPAVDELRQTREKLDAARKIFEKYKERFADTVARKRDPDPYLDTMYISDIEKCFGEIEKAIDSFEITPAIVFDTRDLSNNDKLKDTRRGKLVRSWTSCAKRSPRTAYHRVDRRGRSITSKVCGPVQRDCLGTVIALNSGLLVLRLGLFAAQAVASRGQPRRPG